ncbi:MAG: (4Fe-4S)-binding protein [Candidatus Cloacimonadota bacterium]|nr:MAG: (4Fe-4S)-binding protein [Candidatus Cloacimonadota bacterium]
MIVSVASGKGGTGKTTVATSLALFLEEIYDGKIHFLDCDVEEPNAHIFLKPQIIKRTPFGIPIPEVDFTKCNFCGKCGEVCAYHAIIVVKENVLVFPELCHGCGGCSLLCPQNAIVEKEREIGILEQGFSGRIKFLHGKLNIGEPMASPLIRFVKEVIKTNDANDITIIDVPPGTSCPVVEAVKGSDFTILVTEPTPFGLNDLKLAVETLRKLKIPFGVVVNCAGTGDMGVTEYCGEEEIPLIAEIPYDRNIAVLYSYGVSMLKEGNKYRNIFKRIWEYLMTQEHRSTRHKSTRKEW